jgi:putative transposase
VAPIPAVHGVVRWRLIDLVQWIFEEFRITVAKQTLSRELRGMGLECLIKDRDALLAFYDFPAEHWKHLRTTNVIESSFATVRHRTVRSKGCLSNKTALAMIFKLAEAAERNWRRLNGHNQLPKLILGVRFTDGIEVVKSQAQAAAA